MTNNQNHPDPDDQGSNQNSRRSDAQGDGSRKSAVLGRDDEKADTEKPPAEDARDQTVIEAFDEEGAGIAPKE